MNKIGKYKQNSQIEKYVNKIKESALYAVKEQKTAYRGYSLHFQKFPTVRKQASSS